MMGSQGGTQHPVPLGFKELASLWHKDSPGLLPAFRKASPRPEEKMSRHLPLGEYAAWFGVSLSLPLVG